MNKRYFCLILSLLFYLKGSSQPNTFLKIYSSYNPPFHTGTSVVQTNNGDFILTAVGSSGNTLLLKTDSAGDVLLSKSYCGAGGRSIRNTNDSNYIYISTTVLSCGNSSDYRVVKIDENCDTLWMNTIITANTESSITIRPLRDSSYVIGGSLSGNYAFCKIDSAGALIWNYGVPMSQVWSIIQDSENNFVLCGYLDGFLNSWVVMKTDSTGANVLWAKYYGTTGGFGSEKFYDVVQLPDSNYLLGGFSGVASGIRFMKINKNTGDSFWFDSTQGEIESFDTAANNKYIAAGGNGFYLLNDTGGIVWSKYFQQLNFNWVRSTSDGGFIATGYYWQGTQMWPMLLKTDSLGNFITSMEDLNIQVLNYSIYPNPITTESKLEFGNAKRERYEFALHDITGREIETAFTYGDGIIIKKENKQAGLYLFTLRNENTGEVVNGKIIMQ